MHGFYATANSATAPFLSSTLDAVQLFCLLGVTISIAVVVHLDVESLSWILSNIE
jgi:hypothetical protein